LKNSSTASFLLGALTIKVLKSKRLKVVGGRLSNGFLDFGASVVSSSSSSFFAFGFGASFAFGASFFFSSFFATTPLEKGGNYYTAKTAGP